MEVREKTVIVAGVAGCGKTTIGRALAERLRWTFVEADNFHSQAAKHKMAAGQALNDNDRADWLVALNATLLELAPAVLACSALRHVYREQLTAGLSARFVWIELSPELARERVAGRADHFMPSSLIDSQFATAETPTKAIFLDARNSVAQSVQTCIEELADFVAD